MKLVIVRPASACDRMRYRSASEAAADNRGMAEGTVRISDHLQPLGDTAVILRPFVVNGFDDDLDINEQPSAGLMVEYRPNEDLAMAVTNWWGPEMPGQVGDTLYFVQVQSTWFATPQLALSGEYLYGMTESVTNNLHWQGFLVLVNYDLDEQWRLIGQWSYLDDPDGYITGAVQESQHVSAGLAVYLVPEVEIRTEYRRALGTGAQLFAPGDGGAGQGGRSLEGDRPALLRADLSHQPPA